MLWRYVALQMEEINLLRKRSRGHCADTKQTLKAVIHVRPRLIGTALLTLSRTAEGISEIRVRLAKKCLFGSK